MREMYRKEHLPFALHLGISEADFWQMNPALLLPYQEAYKMRLKREDEIAWSQGQYFLQALLASVGNMFKKKSAEPFEYPQQPFLKDKLDEEKKSKPKELTEEEKKKQTEQLFLSLRVMQTNFNREHNNT